MEENVKTRYTDEELAEFRAIILEKLETGIALVGSELRPCREGRVTLKDSFVDAIDGQLWLCDVHIGSNVYSNRWDHDPERKRRLLAHKQQILKLCRLGRIRQVVRLWQRVRSYNQYWFS